MRVADVALAGIGDAQRAVDEVFDDGVGRHGSAHLGDFLEGQFARQHDLRKADVGQEARLLRRADVALGRCMQIDGRQVEFQQAHVLHDQRIHAGVVTVVSQFARGFQLGIVQDGVERDVDARVEAVRVFHQFGDVGDRIAGLVARAECGAADIDRIGAVQDRFAADGGSLRGGEQFERLG